MTFTTTKPTIEARIATLESQLAAAGCVIPKHYFGEKKAGSVHSEKTYGKGVKTPEQVLAFLQRKVTSLGGAPAGLGMMPTPAARPSPTAPATAHEQVAAAFAAANAEPDPYRRAILFAEASRLLRATASAGK